MGNLTSPQLWGGSPLPLPFFKGVGISCPTFRKPVFPVLMRPPIMVGYLQSSQETGREQAAREQSALADFNLETGLQGTHGRACYGRISELTRSAEHDPKPRNQIRRLGPSQKPYDPGNLKSVRETHQKMLMLLNAVSQRQLTLVFQSTPVKKE